MNNSLKEASVTKRAPKASVADTPPPPQFTYYAQVHHLPNHRVFLWGYCLSGGHHVQG